MNSDISVLSLIACVLYAAVCAACTGAGFEARAKRQQAWHLKTWWLIAVLFILLIASRLLGLEEILREDLRDLLRAEGLVESRRAIQGPVIAVAIVLFAAAGMFAVYQVAQRVRGRRNIAIAVALGACGLMVATIIMRTISLHAFDRLLFGPLKLNWVGDIGASFAVLAAGVYYVSVLRSAPKPSR